MTALSTARMVTGATPLETLDAKLAANAVIYKGALCGFKAGYLVNWVSSDTGIKHPCIAIPELELVIDNTGGSAGDLTCPVKFIEPKHLYRFANDDSPNNIAQANIGGDAWGKDDQTVSASSASGTRSRVGTPWLVITSNTRGYPVGVYVEPESPGADASLEDISALEFVTPTELTIASGAVTVTQAFHTIDTEADAASDNWDTASGTVANQVYIFKPANGGRTVVIRDASVSSGNIRTPFAQSISLAEEDDYAIGISDGTDLTIVAFRTLAANGGGAGAIIGLLSALTTTAATNVVAAVNELDADIGDLSTLTTTATTSTVDAINELDALIGAGLTASKKTLTANATTINAAAATQVINIGTALPANSRIVGVDLHTYTPFSGGTVGDFTVDVGMAGDVDALIDGADLFAAAVDGGPATIPQGIRPNKFYAAGGQLIATFDCASDDVGDATAGAITIDVLYVVLA